MKIYLILILILSGWITDAQTMSLNGKWNFKASNSLSDESILQSNYSAWDQMKVPGNWDIHEKYSTYVGKGYYQKDFTVSKKWQGKQIRIQFEAVYETAKVWVNGKLMGEHVGGYLPFEFNITQEVKLGATNSIVVMADNSYKRGAWWAWGGISRDVRLVANADLRLVYQHISSIPDFEKGEINFSIKYKVENNGAHSATAQILPKIKGMDFAPVSLKINGNTNAISEMKFKRKLVDFKLWHFDNPNLYQLTSELQLDGKKVDGAKDNFGIRKFEVRGEQFFLNNQAVRMNGVNRVHDHPKYGNTEPDCLIKKDMKDIQSLGCTFSRLMHAPLSKNILDFCDKNGFLLVEEIPVWGDDDPQSFPNNPVAKKWMADMIERDFNHPSVVAWSVGNELRDAVEPWENKALTKDQNDYVNDMLDYVASLDVTRLKTYVTITSYRKGEIGSEPYEKVDFISMNSYGNAPVLTQKTHQKFPGKPIFVSEIGLSQIGAGPDAELSKELVGYIKELKQFPWITGVSLWSYNDYRSNYKGTPKSGYREWGIVDAFRKKKKKAYQQLKALYKEWEE